MKQLVWKHGEVDADLERGFLQEIDTDDMDDLLSAMEELADIAYGHFARLADQDMGKCATCGHVSGSESNDWHIAQKLHGIRTKVNNIRQRLVFG